MPSVQSLASRNMNNGLSLVLSYEVVFDDTRARNTTLTYAHDAQFYAVLFNYCRQMILQSSPSAAWLSVGQSAVSVPLRPS